MWYYKLGDYMKVEHPIAPVFNKESKVLILGSFPSVKSREEGFFYGHKQNRFWRVLAEVLGDDLPNTIEEKRVFLLKNGIAVWDVIKSCEITGSADISIKNAVPNDLSEILGIANIKMIFTNGKKAHTLYKKHLEKETGIEAFCLPSTSPANAGWSFEKLVNEWEVIKSGNMDCSAC